MDGALHRHRCTRADLGSQSISSLPGAGPRPARAIAASEPLTESVGESRTRIILCDAGFSVRPQVAIREGSRFLGRVDFLVDDCVVVEF